MTGNIVEIDIGATGALAQLDRRGFLLDVEDMPVLRDDPAKRASVNAPQLADMLAKWHVGEAFVEFVGARPGEGAVGAFAFGRSRGIIEGCCGPLEVRVSFLTPPQWKRLVGIPPGKEGAKDAGLTRRRCSRPRQRRRSHRGGAYRRRGPDEGGPTMNAPVKLPEPAAIESWGNLNFEFIEESAVLAQSYWGSIEEAAFRGDPIAVGVPLRQIRLLTFSIVSTLENALLSGAA